MYRSSLSFLLVAILSLAAVTLADLDLFVVIRNEFLTADAEHP